MVVRCVSIPFKREGLSELKRNNYTCPHRRVSIPFKREGLSEREKRKNTALEVEEFSFYSLQTGRTF